MCYSDFNKWKRVVLAGLDSLLALTKYVILQQQDTKKTTTIEAPYQDTKGLSSIATKNENLCKTK